MSTESSALEIAAPPAWYRTITARQWKVLLVTLPGWMLDSMDVVLYLEAITSLEKEFSFGPKTAGMLATITLLASAVGGVLFGVIADRLGRTRALSLSILIYSFCSLGTATAQSIPQLLIWRLLLGLGMGGEWASGAALLCETWPAEHRGKALGIMHSGWALGYILASLVAAVLLPTFGWRCLFIVGGLPALLIFAIRRGVAESEMWTRQQASCRSGGQLRSLFSPELRGRTLIGTLLAGTALFAYWGVFAWLPAFLSTPIAEGGAGMSIVKSTGWVVTMQFGCFAGYLAFGIISDRIGRRLSLRIFTLTAAVLVPIYGFSAGNTTALLLLGPAVGFFAVGFLSLFGTLLAELFPTRVRATGQGLTFNVGRALGALAPLVVGTLAKSQGLGHALALTSFVFVAEAILIQFVPETRGQQLSD